MDHRASRSAPARRRRGSVLVSLAILGVAIAAFAVRPSLVASAPSAQAGPSNRGQTTLGERRSLLASAPSRPPADVGQPTSRPDALGEGDGVVPDGVAVSVFDAELPAVGKLEPDLLEALRRAATDAGADGVGLRVNSGWRSPEHQQQLLHDAVVEHGSQEEAARWVATVETSAHVSGEAVDIGAAEATAWLAEWGAAHGLCQIYRNEPWHYELRPDAVHDGCPPMYADPTEDPRMQP